MTPQEFLAVVFSAAPPGLQVELRAPGAWQRFTDPFSPALTEDDISNPPKELYFSVGLWRNRTEIAGGTMVWCDCDKETPASWHPTPTFTVSSGKGMHAYWALQEMAPIEAVVRLAKLASMAYNGDGQVTNSQRTMRLPGTFNCKYSPPRRAEVLTGPGPRYTLVELEQELVAAVLQHHWEGGNRHQLTLSLAALLYRTGWPLERAEATVTSVMSLTGDDDERDRMAAVRGTYAKAAAGEFMSSAALRDSFGKKLYREFITALGVTSRDGDILLDGEKIGRLDTIQRDISDFVAATRDWAAADGVLVKWDGRVWEKAHSEVLVSTIFKTLSSTVVVINGIEQEFAATARLAKDIKDVVHGDLLQSSLGPVPPLFVPVQNGVLDLESRSLQPHAREFNARWVLPVRYDPEATAPRWRQFLKEACRDRDGVPLEGVETFLQEWVGYCLQAGNPWQRMLWVFGPSGTGKSTFLQAVSDLLGPASVPIKSGNIDDYGVASLAPARVAVCSELSTKLLKTDKLKALVASDPMVARHPYGRPFQVSFQGKFIWASNSLPPVDQAEGLWRRVVVVPFVKVPDKPDPMIFDKHRAELPGILNWALEGLERVWQYNRSGDWPLPAAVIETVEEYREAADTFVAFAQEEIELDPTEKRGIPAQELYTRYAAWAKRRGYQPEPFGPVFWRELKKVGLRPADTTQFINGRNTRVWLGGRLAPEVFG